MRRQGAKRTPEERLALANYLSGASSAAPTNAAPSAPQAASAPASAPSAGQASASDDSVEGDGPTTRTHTSQLNICKFVRPTLNLTDPHWNGWATH